MRSTQSAPRETESGEGGAFLEAGDPELLVVTVQVGAERAGCLVGFSTQCSIKPPRFLVCLSVRNRSFTVAKGADVLGVHRLGSHQRALASIFGELTSDEDDKFARCTWTTGAHGAPILADADAWLEGEILEQVPFGDHVGFVLGPLASGGSLGVSLRLRDVDLSPGHPA